MVLKLAEKTLELREKALPYQHPDTLSSMYDVARAHYDLRNYDDAEGQADQLYPLDKRIFSEMSPQTIQTLLLKADARFKIGRRDEAEPLLSRATDLYSRAGIYDNTFGKLSEIYIYRMKYPDAVLTLRLALRDSQKVSGTDRTTLDAMVFLAFSLFYMADYDEAEPVARKAVIEGKGIFGAADSQTVKPQILLEKIKIAIRDIDLERIPRNRASIGHALNAKLPFMCQISNWLDFPPRLFLAVELTGATDIENVFGTMY
ncbi:unnamed protein product [Clonostachys chloroleuca]|uniref:Uncharacterized protein n=1 Tax=Clonostachys chloroleuca TaxID=1926264 RepID=A0AA35M827_9HYPO|nr:unnamed protein product [Clonostachys chloroleuca]